MNYVDNYLMEISLLIILISFNGIYDAPSSHLQADVVLERSTNREYIRHNEGWFQSMCRDGGSGFWGGYLMISTSKPQIVTMKAIATAK